MNDSNGLFPFYDAPVEEFVTIGDSITGMVKNLKKIKDITVLEKQYVEKKLKELESDGLADPLIVLEDLLSDICKKEQVNRDEAQRIVTFVENADEKITDKKTKGFESSSKKAAERSDKKKELNQKNKETKQTRDKYIAQLTLYSKVIEEYNERRKYHQAFSIVRYRLIPLVENYDELSEADRNKLATEFLAQRPKRLIELLADFWEKEANQWKEQDEGKSEELKRETQSVATEG